MLAPFSRFRNLLFLEARMFHPNNMYLLTWNLCHYKVHTFLIFQMFWIKTLSVKILKIRKVCTFLGMGNIANVLKPFLFSPDSKDHLEKFSFLFHYSDYNEINIIVDNVWVDNPYSPTYIEWTWPWQKVI